MKTTSLFLTVLTAAAAVAVTPAAAQESRPTGTFNRMCVIFDRSGSFAESLDSAWQKVERLARQYRVQPEDELIVVAMDSDPRKVYDGPAADLVRGGRKALHDLRRIAQGSGTDVITAIEICADELRRDDAPSRRLLWGFTDLHIDPSPTHRVRKMEDFDWTMLREVEARFYYVDPGRGGEHIRRWRALLRDRGVAAILFDPLRSEHELYDPPAVRMDGDSDAVFSRVTGLLRRLMAIGAIGFVLIVAAGVGVSARRRREGVRA